LLFTVLLIVVNAPLGVGAALFAIGLSFAYNAFAAVLHEAAREGASG
jgi:ABC-type sulfate transport system permease component